MDKTILEKELIAVGKQKESNTANYDLQQARLTKREADLTAALAKLSTVVTG